MQQEIWFNKYRIIRILGRGGTAKVYLAEHIKLNSHRAIKCLSKNSPFYELQLKEAQILKNLKHSCIPTIYDIEEDQDGSYIVEQYLEGDTLKEIVNKKSRIGTHIIIHFALQICDLIQYLHSIERPILYLDLKPENIIITNGTLKLVDFGSAIYRDEAGAGQEFYGTRGYAAPEMYRRDTIDERSDVYGIGMLLYYMVTGNPINIGASGMVNIDLINDCPKSLKKIINRCLKFNPSQRYASVTQLSRQLSAGRGKCKFYDEPGKSIRVAVAGAGPRIGVTHLSFRLCRYFVHRKIRCIYREKNDSRCIWLMKNRVEGLSGREDIYKKEGIPMLRQDQAGHSDLSGYPIILDDYGCLTDANLTDFMEADFKILILGAKDWELKYAEQVLDMVAEYKDIVYLFNFLDGRQYQQAMKNMDRRICFRIPYEPDPFAKFKDGSATELFRELAKLCPWERGIRKDGSSGKKTDIIK